jgi:ABC-type glutathione transport system ATPase component
LLLVEHDVAMVLSLCSKIFVLDFGQLIAEGCPDSVRNNPAVKAAYLGDTPVRTAVLDKLNASEEPTVAGSVGAQAEAETASPR